MGFLYRETKEEIFRSLKKVYVHYVFGSEVYTVIRFDPHANKISNPRMNLSSTKPLDFPVGTPSSLRGTLFTTMEERNEIVRLSISTYREFVKQQTENQVPY